MQVEAVSEYRGLASRCEKTAFVDNKEGANRYQSNLEFLSREVAMGRSLQNSSTVGTRTLSIQGRKKKTSTRLR